MMKYKEIPYPAHMSFPPLSKVIVAETEEEQSKLLDICNSQLINILNDDKSKDDFEYIIDNNYRYDPTVGMWNYAYKITTYDDGHTYIDIYTGKMGCVKLSTAGQNTAVVFISDFEENGMADNHLSL